MTDEGIRCVATSDEGVVDFCYCGDLLRCEGGLCNILEADAESCADGELPECDDLRSPSNGPLGGGSLPFGTNIPAATLPAQTIQGGGTCQLNPSASPQGLAFGFGWFGLVGLLLVSLRRGQDK